METLEEPGNAGNEPPYPEHGNIAELLKWHLFVHGTRPGNVGAKRGELWKPLKFSDACDLDDETYRSVRNWLNGAAEPNANNRRSIARALLGGRTDPPYDQWRADILGAPAAPKPPRDSRAPNSQPKSAAEPAEPHSTAGGSIDSIADLGFVPIAEIEIEKRKGRKPRAVEAALQFEQQLLVPLGENRSMTVSIQKAWLLVDAGGRGRLRLNLDWVGIPTDCVSYAQYRDNPDGVTVEITALPGCMLPLAPLPPGHPRNFWSKVANLAPEVPASDVTANLDVSLRPEHLHMPDAGAGMTDAKKECLAAIMAILAGKSLSPSGDKLRQSVPVFEQE